MKWIPSRTEPLPPKPGWSAPEGDIPELIAHLRTIMLAGAAIAEAEQAWVEGMSLICQRAQRFRTPHTGDNRLYHHKLDGEISLYTGPKDGAYHFALVFNMRTSEIVQGLCPSRTDGEMFQKKVIYEGHTLPL